MNLNFLWQIRFLRAWSSSLMTGGVILIGFWLTQTQKQTFMPWLVIVASVLLFAFLARLPRGRRWQRLLGEIGFLLAACGLMLFLLGLLYRQYGEVFDTRSAAVSIVLSVVSYIIVRIFARPYTVWNEMRRRRLVWEITHAQLRLVVLTMLVLFVSLLGYNLYINQQAFSQQPFPDALSDLLILLIAAGGFFGLLTMGLLFVVIIPASVISYLTARRITGRLAQLVAVTSAIRQADYALRVNVQGEDEIARLQAEFNHMLDALEATRRDLETERDSIRHLLDSRKRLFADVSHELRTPVATLRLMLPALGAPQPDPASLPVIEREVLRLQHLIEDVVTLARADNQQLTYSLTSVAVCPLLENAIQTVRPQTWQAKKIEVILDCPPQLPPVCADAERLEQILLNLLRNAVRHTPPGGLIRLSAHPAGQHILIQVEDTGEGISPDDLPYIWDRFYRSAATRAQDTGGSGLGLALVKEMTEAMGGQVTVSSQVGQGSCFSLSLPCHP